MEHATWRLWQTSVNVCACVGEKLVGGYERVPSQEKNKIKTFESSLSELISRESDFDGAKYRKLRAVVNPLRPCFCHVRRS